MLSVSVKEQTAKDEADVRAVVETRHKAHRDKDAATIAAQYAGDAVLFTLAPPLAHYGMDVPQLKSWLDSWDGPVDLESRDFDFTVSGDYAFGHGFYKMSGTNKAAHRPVSFWMRATVCLHREPKAWRIVHEHTAVPFYMDGSLRPAFDLQPKAA